VSERSVVLAVWEVGVDHCDLCGREAEAAAARVDEEGHAELVLACADHVEQLGISSPWGHATCMHAERLGSGELVPCGAAATHVLLLGLYQNDEPRLSFLPVCPRHAESVGEST